MQERKSIPQYIYYVYTLLIAYISIIPFYYLPYVHVHNTELPVFKYFPLISIALIFWFAYNNKYFHSNIIVANSANISVAIYFILTLFSGIFTPYYFISISKALYYGMTGILIYFVMSSFRLKETDIGIFIRSFVLIAFIVSLYGLVTFILGKDILFSRLPFEKSNIIHPNVFLKAGRISSTFGNPHFLGSFLSCVFPLSIYLWLKQRGLRNFLIYMTASVVLFFATLLTFSMGAYISIIVFFLFYLKFRTKYQFSISEKIIKNILLVYVIVILSTIILIASNLFAKVYYPNSKTLINIGKIDFDKLANPEGFTYRWDSISTALRYWNINYGLGIGIGRIGRGSGLIHRITMDNFYCLSLIEYGFIPTLAMFIVFVIFFKNVHNSKVSINIPLISILEMSLVSFFINMFFWDLFNHPTMRIVFWSLTGILGSLVHSVRSSRKVL